MKLSKETVEILKNFSSINSNLVIHSGNRISTVSATKDILAIYVGKDVFDKEVSLFNVSEMLGAYYTFKEPEIILEDKFLTIKQGKQQVKYVYHEKGTLIYPQKDLVMPPVDVKVELSNELITRMQKMSSILSVEDLAIIGDGKTVSVKVFNKKNPTANTFEIDLETKTKDTFNINFKIEKLRLFPSNYKVELSSKKISRWSATDLNLVVFVAIEADSVFK